MIPVRKIQIEKAKIIKNCKKCKGIGCNSCIGYGTFIDKMVEAEIPVDYWFRMIEDFYGDENLKKFIISYGIEDEYSKGTSLFLFGGRGTGKTFAACSILKKALLENYSAFYITLSDLVTYLLGARPEFKLLLKEFDFVVIDEVDKRFFPSQQSMELYGNQLENILRSRMQNRLPTILCSNTGDMSQIFDDGQFQTSFISLSSQFMKQIPVIGKDARENKEKI